MAAIIMEISAGLQWLASRPASSHYASSWILNWSILKYDFNINSKCQELSSLKKCLLKRLNLKLNFSHAALFLFMLTE